ncbi:hypothetical protein FPOAC2_12768 [Fusarium poae]|jgi:hypothetical protein
MAPLVYHWSALSLLLPRSHSVAPSFPLETRFLFLGFFALPAHPFIPIPHSSIDPSISTKRLNNSICQSLNQLIDIFSPKTFTHHLKLSILLDATKFIYIEFDHHSFR